MNLLIVDETTPHRVLRLTVTVSDGDATGALLRGDIAIDELGVDEVFDLLQAPPEERTVIVHSSAVRLNKLPRPPAPLQTLSKQTAEQTAEQPSPYHSALALLSTEP